MFSILFWYDSKIKIMKTDSCIRARDYEPQCQEFESLQ